MIEPVSIISCDDCSERFDGRLLPLCPDCQAGVWAATERLVREKHDPGASVRLDTYRSVITPRAKSELRAVLLHAARHGRWFYDRDYAMWVHVTTMPEGRAPGVGILAGGEQADHALDCLFIAEANDPAEAHVFAADGERHEAQVRAGVFEPLGGCTSVGCDNLAAPGREACGPHAKPV
jgi:hypothetical protein